MYFACCVFHTLVVHDLANDCANDATNLGTACSLYYIALTNLNSRLPKDRQFTIHRGDAYSATDAPGTQVPWMSRLTLLEYPSSMSLPSLVSMHDSDISSSVDSEDMYAAIDRDDTVDNIEVRPLSASSSPF